MARRVAREIHEDINAIGLDESGNRLVVDPDDLPPVPEPRLEPLGDRVAGRAVAVGERLVARRVVLGEEGLQEARDGMIVEVRRDETDPEPAVRRSIVEEGSCPPERSGMAQPVRPRRLDIRGLLLVRRVQGRIDEVAVDERDRGIEPGGVA